MYKSILILVTLLICPRGVQAGLDKFSFLDQVENWIIERKFNSSNETISCRASIPKNGTWFGARIRLDGNDQLLFPSEHLKKALSLKTIKSVRKALKACRTGLIYLPNEIGQ
ncbi:hypothetical protein [Prochlorococcus sp. MIT 1307]|uniref:hypothetical protein n=1 Tax=Prochlorococcus sp. MIT 1307 TaxID=3096219 RepID=UPI002A74E91A|nr:hypothetical protein [Prochlorococcus sp. MIT 1307]